MVVIRKSPFKNIGYIHLAISRFSEEELIWDPAVLVFKFNYGHFSACEILPYRILSTPNESSITVPPLQDQGNVDCYASSSIIN